ncbi:MAG: hypothetical protein WCP93_03170 [Candidatus Berkelbacteria bacterium]
MASQQVLVLSEMRQRLLSIVPKFGCCACSARKGKFGDFFCRYDATEDTTAYLNFGLSDWLDEKSLDLTRDMYWFDPISCRTDDGFGIARIGAIHLIEMRRPTKQFKIDFSGNYYIETCINRETGENGHVKYALDTGEFQEAYSWRPIGRAHAGFTKIECRVHEVSETEYGFNSYTFDKVADIGQRMQDMINLEHGLREFSFLVNPEANPLPQALTEHP